MAYGMPAGMAELLQRKYAILQQQADANTVNATSNRTAAEAGAKLDTARARELPLDSASQRALQGRQADFIGEQIRFYGDDIMSQIGLRRTQGASNLASAYTSLAQGRSINDLVDTNASAVPGAQVTRRSITAAPSISSLMGMSGSGGSRSGGAPSRSSQASTSPYGKTITFDDESLRRLGAP